MSHATFTDKKRFQFHIYAISYQKRNKTLLVAIRIRFYYPNRLRFEVRKNKFQKSKEQQIHLTTKNSIFQEETAFALIDVLFPKREKAFVFSIVNQKVDEADMRHKLLQFHHHLV